MSLFAVLIVSCSNSRSDYLSETVIDNATADSKGVISLKHLTSEVGGSRAVEQQIQFGTMYEGSTVGITMYSNVETPEIEYNNLCYDIVTNGDLNFNVEKTVDDEETDPVMPLAYNLNFYSYAPFRAGFTSNGSYDFTVQTDQREVADYVASDLMWGKVENVSDLASARIRYRHLYTIININLTLDINVKEKQVKSGQVTVEGVKPTATVNLADGTLSAAKGDVVSVRAFDMVDDGNGSIHLSGSVVIPPQSYAAEAEIVRVYWSGSGKYLSFVLSGAANLLGGKYYNINRTITAESLAHLTSGVEGNIKEWVVLEENSIDAEFERE